MKPLKDLVLNRRQIKREMNKPRTPLDTSRTHAVAFRIEGDTLKVVGFR